MSKNVHVVPHMHWDREWYFTAEESRALLIQDLEEVMEMLETNENYPYYVLDGQTAILEDYFAVKPENRERVKALAQAGKLIIGPWYTQTDEMVVGGESIVRNLLYGLKDTREFCEPMMIGYLPDSFGQSEKLPQILNGFDITRAMFWRGASERHGTNKHNFKWQSLSEGEVVVQLLPLGYAIGKYLPEDLDALATRMNKYMPVLERGATCDEILLPNGHDQMPIQKNIFEVMKQLKVLYPQKEFFLSKYENVFDEVEKLSLDTIKGELLDGKYMRVHRSIFSSRADLKAYNTRIENKLTNTLEPLASLAHSFGVSYEEGFIEKMWKELMKNHAHDSIGCCCSDKVHKQIEGRFFIVEDQADEMIKFYKRKLVDAMSLEKTLDKFVAFNLVAYEREQVVEGQIITKMKNFNLVDPSGKNMDFEVLHSEVIDAGLIDRQIVHYGDYDPFMKYTVAFKDTLPAMGFKAYLIEECEGVVANATSTNATTIENDFYTIRVEENGTLHIEDKKSNKTYSDVLLVEDGSDDGDEYDFSPLADDFIITSKDVKANVSVHTFTNKSEVEISFNLAVPKDLDSRKAKVIDGDMDVTFKLNVYANSPIIEVQAIINNRACDHRVRVYVPNQMASQFTISDNQFGSIQRPVRDSAMDVWEKERWNERPDSIYPMLSYVALDNEDGLAVLTNSVREFEVIGEDYDTIAVTLFRGVAFLGKEEMLRRPGRPSGIKMPTPDAQLLTTLTFDFAIVRKDADLAKHAKEYITPVETYNKMPYNAMKLNEPDFVAPYEYSMFSIDNANIITSAVKKAQDKDGLIVRVYHSHDAQETFAFNSNDFVLQAQTNLNEDVVSEMENTSLTINKNVITTYLLKSK